MTDGLQRTLLAPEAVQASAPAHLPDPSARLVEAFRAVAVRMEGLNFVNPALEVSAVGFAPWAGHWLGVLVTPWFMNLTLAPRDPAVWQAVEQGKVRRYRFPAGDFDFIGAHDDAAGEYQLCSLFSPVLEFEDQVTARTVAQLARDALFDTANAEAPQPPPADVARALAPRSDAPGPIAVMEANLDEPLSKRDFLRGRLPGSSHDDRR
jgi:[NiFe] hydrogenase assembly HybE family chaperone